MSNSGKSVGFGSIAALIILVVIALNVFGDKNIEIGKSTVKREKLENQASAQTDYYTDGLGWVKAPSDLEEGMKAFYNKTGVQPYLYLTDEVNGSHYPERSELEAFSRQKYSELFDDEKHLLVVLVEYDNQHKVFCFSGKEAESVMDKEAQSILNDYIEKYYSRFRNRAKRLSLAFEKTSERIMKITRPAIFYLLIMAAGIAALAVTQHLGKKAVRKKRIERENMEKLMNTPIETFGEDEVERLADKYD